MFAMLKNSVYNSRKNLLASPTHSHRAKLASLARKTKRKKKNLMVAALRAPTYVNFALSVARFIALSILV